MNAEVNPYTASLSLASTENRPRRLELNLLGSTLFLELLSERGLYLCGANDRLENCDIDISRKHLFLHIGRSSFLVSADEAGQISAAFEAHGLKVVEATT